MKFEAQKVRNDFPALTQKVRGKPLVYLDSAATTLKPWPVIEKIGHFYTYGTANVHRGAHFLADQATVAFEATRESIRQFINAKSTEEIIFTKGTTEAINLVAASYGEKFVEKDDVIVITQMEHHANIVPWQILCEKSDAILKVVSVLDDGTLNLQAYHKILSEGNVKVVAFVYASNALGTVNPAKEIIDAAKKAGAVTVVDGAQIVLNRKVDVQDLGCDFFAFSAHKLLGPNAVGVLYGRKELLNQMPPYQAGGSMISQVTFEQTKYNELPYKFEAGTPAIGEVIAMKSALDYVSQFEWPDLKEHEDKIVGRALAELRDLPFVKILGTADDRVPVISFSVDKIHSADIGQILDQEGVAVRVGHHCTQPLLARFGLTHSVRASFSIYSSEKDVSTFITALIKAKDMLS